MKALFCPMEALKVFHHLLHVVFRVAVLDVSEPATSHSDDYGHHQHEVLQMVMSVHCETETNTYFRQEFI